jgi:hypothetical protein
MEDVALDRFITILEEYGEYWVRITGLQTENRTPHVMKTKRRD